MDFVTIASTGNAQDYGDLMVATKTHSGATNFHGGLQIMAVWKIKERNELVREGRDKVIKH